MEILLKALALNLHVSIVMPNGMQIEKKLNLHHRVWNTMYI